MAHIGERIRQKRLELGYTLEELAQKTGYKSRTSIQKIETSRKLPADKIELFAKALETTPSYIMGWEDHKPIPNLSDDEAELIKAFRSLNAQGQQKLLERSRELVSLGYKKEEQLQEYIVKEV
jgi:transcriptional regulator with XRE-family HTH domain